MYTKEQRRLLRILKGVVRWKKGKKQARLQKRRLIRKIEYWEKTKKKAAPRPDSKTDRAPAISAPPSPPLPQTNPSPQSNSLPQWRPALKPESEASPQTEIREARHEKFPEAERLASDIVLFRFPIIDWNYRWQRPQQICRQFAQNGTRVFYFSIETIGIQNPEATYEDIQSQLRVEEVESNVWVVRLCSFSSLNAYRDLIKPLDKRYLNWSIEALKARFDIRHTVSIIDLPFWSMLVFDLKQNKTIYDCMDEHSGFSNSTAELLALEPALLKKADIVVASSNSLYRKAKAFADSVELIPNAGEFEFFSSRPSETPDELKSMKGPVIGYIGAIAEWFDAKLVCELALRNRHWNFVFVGDTFYCDTSEIGKLPNVHLLGEKPYVELPKYLHAFDVCIIPFVLNKLTIATNPVKVYEYLAAGKPVVSTDLPELGPMSDVVRLADGPAKFELAIREAFKEKSNPESVAKRREYAAANTWIERYRAFNSLIMNKLYPKISVVVVTHNNWHVSRRCMESLLRNSDYPRLETIIVDNASEDETQANLLKLNDSPVHKKILLPENTGFAAGNTIGVINATGNYVVLLNNDTIVPEGWLQRLLRPFAVDPEIGAVGPVSNHVGNDQKLDFFLGDAANGPDEDWLQEFYELYDGRMRYTELLGFFCVAVKKEVFDKIGHLDKNFGIGLFEDDDYCLRMLEAGYRLAIAEDAFVFHQGSASFKKWNMEQYAASFMTNKAYFEEKWGRKWKPHKLPMSPFIHVNDSEKVAGIIANSGKRPILAYCPDDWNHPHTDWQRKLLNLCQEDTLVIARIRTYRGTPVPGIRKIGPGLYVTSDEKLLEHAVFKEIHSFGENPQPMEQGEPEACTE